MNGFTAPLENFGPINAQTVASLLGVAADIALVIDKSGVIRDMSLNSDELRGRNTSQWIGKKWLDTVCQDSRGKVAELLSNEPDATQQRRQINHLSTAGEDFMLLYSTVVINDKGYRIAIGKDLSSLSRVQQRLVNVQQSMERDYFQLRQFETRYRLLFKFAGDGIIIAQAHDFRVVEANQAACSFFDVPERKLVGSNMLRWFDSHSKQHVEDALASMRINGRNVSPVLELDSLGEAMLVHLALFKTNTQTHVLIRIEKKIILAEKSIQAVHSARLLTLAENSPDALVVTDKIGEILTVNTEFLNLSQLSSAEMAIGQELSSWLGQSGIDFQIIMSSLREHRSIRLYATQIRGELGSYCEVEVSAVELEDEDLGCIGFSIRNTARRVVTNPESSPLTPKSIDQITQLVGRVPLKDLVRESTELIEQLCIESALKLSNNNRVSAAEMLGLSRQSLYVKLRRYTFDNEKPAN